PDLATMHRDDALGDRQAEAGTPLCLGGRAVGLLELFENFDLVSGINPRPSVTHGERISAINGHGFDDDLAEICEFDGIADKIEKNLSKSAFVAMSARQIGWHLDLER